MSAERDLLEDTAEGLFEDAPCGYLATRLDGTIVRVNRAFEALTGLSRAELLAGRRFQDLLSPGGRIYHETHYAPLLRMQGSVREIAVEIVRADGSRLPALVNSTLGHDAEGEPRVIRTTVFDATDRRRYEEELLGARRREREIALELQRSLLGGDLPSSPAFEVEVAYRPADRATEVGGDWYDGFWIEEDRVVGLVVGDVVGRGLGAAATMGQLRSAVRALASTGLRPAALLEALDGYSRRHGIGQMATLVHAQLDLRTRELRYACAGHPPPLVAVPGEAPCLLWEGRSVPLDAQVAERPREEAVHVLAPGATVVLYTDGLVESSSQPIGEGLERLVAQVGAQPDHAPAVLAGALVAALADPRQGDDVCLLAARLAQQPGGAAARCGHG